jgi:hypothetical protein
MKTPRAKHRQANTPEEEMNLAAFHITAQHKDNEDEHNCCRKKRQYQIDIHFSVILGSQLKSD